MNRSLRPAFAEPATRAIWRRFASVIVVAGSMGLPQLAAAEPSSPRKPTKLVPPGAPVRWINASVPLTDRPSGPSIRRVYRYDVPAYYPSYFGVGYIPYDARFYPPYYFPLHAPFYPPYYAPFYWPYNSVFPAYWSVYWPAYWHWGWHWNWHAYWPVWFYDGYPILWGARTRPVVVWYPKPADWKPRDAKTLAERATKNPQRLEELFVMGRDYYFQGDHSEALPYFDAAILVNGNDPRFWAFKALTEYFLGLESAANSSRAKYQTLVGGNPTLIHDTLERVQGPIRMWLSNWTKP